MKNAGWVVTQPAFFMGERQPLIQNAFVQRFFLGGELAQHPG
jgi:hypothetical protein